MQHPKDQKLRDGVYQRMESLCANGVKVAIATNQGGVAASHKTMGDAEKELRFCLSLLPKPVVCNAVTFMCPDFDGQECWQLMRTGFPWSWLCNVSDEGHSFRKPRPGMLLLAMKRHGITDPSKCLMVGDRPEDQQAAIAAGIDFEWA